MPYRFQALLLVGFVSVSGCAVKPAARPVASESVPQSDPVNANISLLFIGNSHTYACDLPELVSKMVRHVTPGKTVACRVVSVPHLEQAANDPSVQATIESQKWTFVVLQAQKISSSGKIIYSTKDGIALAKVAKDHGAKVYFFSEWARKGIDWERKWTEDIYAGMAKEADVGLIPVGRAWDAALAKQPDLPLHDFDGNHESETGAFLTASVIAGMITGERPAKFVDLPGSSVNAETRKTLVDAAETVFAKPGEEKKESPVR